MKTLLLTGATGLIGTNFLKTMPSDVFVFGIGKEDNVAMYPMADYIIHAGGYGQPAKFMADELATICVNTKTTLELLRKLKPDGKFLFISTSEVYSGAEPPYKETDIGTTTPTHPRACYIESKRCGETICMAYRRMGYDVKIARLCLAYGATRKGDARVLNQLIEHGMDGKIQLLDKGNSVRTYCYVEDAVGMMWDILLYGTQPLYNVGGYSKTTIAGLARKIGKILGAEVFLGKENKEDAPEEVSVDVSLYEKEFGKRELVDLETGLKKTIRCYIEH
mgnify:CR=1 FL=1